MSRNREEKLKPTNFVKTRRNFLLTIGMSFAFSALAGMILRTFFPSYEFLMKQKIPDFIQQFFIHIPIVNGLWFTFENIIQLIYGYIIFTIPFFVLYLIFKKKTKPFISLRGGSVQDAKDLRDSMLLHENMIIEYKATKKDFGNKKIYEHEWGNEQIPLDPEEASRGLLLVAKPGAGKTVAINNIIHGNVKEIYVFKTFKFLYEIYDNLSMEDKFLKNNLRRLINILPRFYKKINRKLTSRGVKEFNKPMIFLERKGDDFAPKLLHRDLLNKNHFLLDPTDKDTIKWNFIEEAIDKKTGEVDTGLLFFMVKILYPADETDHFAAQAQTAVFLIIIVIAFSKKPTLKHLIDYLQSHQDVMSLRKSILRNETINRLGFKGAAESIFTIDEETGGPDGQARGVQSSMGRFISKICLQEFYFEDSNFTITEFFRKLDKIEDYEKYKNMRLGVQNEASLNGRYNLYYGLFFALIFKRGFAMEQRESRKILLLLDEVQSFAEGDNKPLAKAVLEGLNAFLAESRSRGFFTIVATQSLALVMDIIGDKMTNSLFQLLSAKLIMQYDEPLGAKFICDYFGEEEIEEMNESESTGAEFNSTKASTSFQKRMNKKILPAELTDLKKRSGFFKQGHYPITKLTFGINSGVNISPKRINRIIPETFNNEDIETYRATELILDYSDEIVRIYEKYMKEGKDLTIPILSEQTKLSENLLFKLSEENQKVREIINEVYNVNSVVNFIDYCKQSNNEMSWENWRKFSNLNHEDLKILSKKYKKVADFYSNIIFYKEQILYNMNDFNRQKEEIDMYIRDNSSNIQGYRDLLIVDKLLSKFNNLSKDDILLYLFALLGSEVVEKGSLIKSYYINYDFEKALKTISELSNKKIEISTIETVVENIQEETLNVDVLNGPDEPLDETINKSKSSDDELKFEIDYSNDLPDFKLDDISIDEYNFNDLDIDNVQIDPYN
jgi:hypothetical protein